MESLTTAPEFTVESYLLQIPGGYQLLDMLVQANVDVRRLTRDDVERLLGNAV